MQLYEVCFAWDLPQVFYWIIFGTFLVNASGTLTLGTEQSPQLKTRLSTNISLPHPFSSCFYTSTSRGGKYITTGQLALDASEAGDAVP